MEQVVMLKQPMPKADLEGNGYVSARSPLPVVAEESCQRLTYIPKLAGAFNVINIKLMKCGSTREAALGLVN